MIRLISLFTVLLTVAAAATAAAPAVENVQGFYEGTRLAGQNRYKIEARVVALGKGEFKALVREPGKDGAVTKYELNGKISGKAVTFQGKTDAGEWSARYDDGKITGKAGKDAKIELKRVVRESPTMGAKPPAGAIVLLDGKNFDEVERRPDKQGNVSEWKTFKDGGVLVAKRGIHTKRTFAGSFKLHLEFKNPLMPEKRSQGRGNSGCFMPNGNEVQVLDSFGMTTYKGGGCGGIYRFKNPDVFDEFALASTPPGQWQTYDITYEVEVKDGKPTGKPVLTVLHNGIKIHDKFQLPRKARAGRIQFQDHRDPVQYRNIWILETK